MVDKKLRDELVSIGLISPMSELIHRGVEVRSRCPLYTMYVNSFSLYDNHTVLLDNVVIVVVDVELQNEVYRHLEIDELDRDLQGYTFNDEDKDYIILYKTMHCSSLDLEETLHHELIHVQQRRSGRLVYDVDGAWFDGVYYEYTNEVDVEIHYPHELEAYTESSQLSFHHWCRSKVTEWENSFTPTPNITKENLYV